MSADPHDDVAPGESDIALALSGGGYRATLFGLGSLYRLNELGYLRTLRRISSVSGGSILAGYLGFRWRDLSFEANGVATNFPDVIVAPIRRFCSLRIDAPAIVKGIVTPFMSVSDFLVRAYDRELFRRKDGSPATLQDLPRDDEGPRFVICATSLQTRAAVRFSRPYIADYNLGQWKDPKVRLSVAVAASSAFPPFLSPVRLRSKPSDWVGPPNAKTPALHALRSGMVLTDAGVYDNLGLEPLKRFSTVLVADAGGPATIELVPHTNWLAQLVRAREIMMEQTRALRRRTLVAELTQGRRAGAFWGIGTRIGDYQLDDALTADSKETGELKNVRTRLNPFTDQEQTELINWGYALCDAALRKHMKSGPRPTTWPVGGTFAFPIRELADAIVAASPASVLPPGGSSS